MAKASLVREGVIRETDGNPGVTTLKRVDEIASPRSSISPFETKYGYTRLPNLGVIRETGVPGVAMRALSRLFTMPRDTQQYYGRLNF